MTDCPHDHDLELALVCTSCGLVMVSEEARRIESRLIRYVAPASVTSDTLTSAQPSGFVFELVETVVDG